MVTQTLRFSRPITSAQEGVEPRIFRGLSTWLRDQPRQAPPANVSERQMIINRGTAAAAPTLRRIVHAHLEILAPIDARIDEFLQLPRNWDSYGADVISPESASCARELALFSVYSSMFDVEPSSYSLRVFPLAEGGIQLEWESGNRYLEVEVGPETTLAYLYIDRSSDVPTSASGASAPL